MICNYKWMVVTLHFFGGLHLKRNYLIGQQRPVQPDSTICCNPITKNGACVTFKSCICQTIFFWRSKKNLGVSFKYGYPQIIRFNSFFFPHYEASSYCGTPILGNSHVGLIENGVYPQVTSMELGIWRLSTGFGMHHFRAKATWKMCIYIWKTHQGRSMWILLEGRYPEKSSLASFNPTMAKQILQSEEYVSIWINKCTMYGNMANNMNS